jgi:hypothetical protein
MKEVRNKKGQFAKGTCGRQKGTVGGKVISARAVVKANSNALVKKALVLALKGNEKMLALFVGKLLPKNGLVPDFKLPASGNPETMSKALIKILNQPHVVPDDLQGAVNIIHVHLDAVETQNVLGRLQELDEQGNNTL